MMGKMADPTPSHFTKDGLTDTGLSFPSLLIPCLLTSVKKQRQVSWAAEQAWATHLKGDVPQGRTDLLGLCHIQNTQSFLPGPNWNYGGNKTVPQGLPSDLGLMEPVHGSAHLADGPAAFDADATGGAGVLGAWITTKLKPIRRTKAPCSYD